MQTTTPSPALASRVGVVFGALVLRGVLNLGSLDAHGLLPSLGGGLLVLGYLHWLDRQGKGGVSPERLSQTGPTPLDRHALPTLLTIVIGFFMFLGPFGVVAMIIYFATAADPKRRKNRQAPAKGDLLTLFTAVGQSPDRAKAAFAAFEAKVEDQARASGHVAPAPKPKPKPKPKTARLATEPPVPPSTWGTLEPTADTRADWFGTPAPEPAIAQTSPTSGLAAGEVAPFYVAPASALGDWSLGTSSTITTSSVAAVSYDQTPYTPVSYTDHFRQDSAPSGFDEALALLQGKPADKRRD